MHQMTAMNGCFDIELKKSYDSLVKNPQIKWFFILMF